METGRTRAPRSSGVEARGEKATGKEKPRLARMAILVDEALWSWRGRRWAHLVSDRSYEELHEFAGRLGIPQRAFQGDHYDIPTELRHEAIARGAQPVNSRELVVRLRGAGLRRTHRGSGTPGGAGLSGRRPVDPGDAVPPAPAG